VQGVQGTQGPQGAFPSTAGGDLTGTYPNPTVQGVQGTKFASGINNGWVYMQSTTRSEVEPVNLAGDIILAAFPAGVGGSANYQVRGLYGQPMGTGMSGPTTGETVRYTGGQWVPCATAGNISNGMMYMNNPGNNESLASGFNVISYFSPANIPLNAMQTYLMIGTVSVTGTVGTVVEVGWSQSSTSFVISGGWACNNYFHLPVTGYLVSVTCWAFIGNAAASTMWLCVNTNATGVTVIRNGINYCTAGLAMATGYGNS
jgi:hypothetical protein